MFIRNLAEPLYQSMLCCRREELHEREVVVSVHRKPTVRCGNEPASADSLDLTCEAFYSFAIGQVFQHCIRIDDVEGPIGKR